MPKIKPEYSLLPPEEAKKEDQKQQQSVDQESKDNLTFKNDENRDKNAATTNKTDAKIGKSDAKPGQIKEKEIKEKKTKENFLKIQVKGEGEKFENLEFDRWQKELLDDEDWCATLVRFSGKGLAVLDCAHEAMEIFRDYLILRDQIEQNNTRKEFQYNFIAWWRFNNFTTNMDELRRGKKGVVLRPAWNEEKRKQSKIENLNQVFNDAEFIAKKMFCNHE